MVKTQLISPMNRALHVQSGFTLIEVLIAVSILTVGLLGVATMQISGIRGNSFSDSTTVSLTLAEEKMEDLLGKIFSHADLTNGNHDEGNIDAAGNAGSIYHRTWSVANNTPIANNKTIVITVAWDSDQHSVSLTSIKRL